MGGASSTRRVTVVNDDASGVIKISDSVVHRLRGEKDKEKEDVKSGPQKKNEEHGSEPSLAPFFDNLQWRQQREKELQQTENSWKLQVEELEKHNQELSKLVKTKFYTELVDVEEKYIKQTYAPVCEGNEQKVMKCYQDNAKTPLNCSKEVMAFSQCVDRVRMGVLTSHG
ncbi:coiled-coil-helix-coiled-coil-helix domain containing 3 [Tachypleus tridentatus]|uniref:coiled-coil-helix-coiled-coil-helix domain containing 3 n=1 Tax=Tachypleus tridentatus TaxID=6853 RepID=UPI003FD64477